ncbi:Phosphopantetheine adenylyltransferase [compost metagenome]
MNKTTKTGIVAGSFDPITSGHLWLIREALALVDELIVVVGVNPSKKYYFTSEERRELVDTVLRTKLDAPDYARVRVVFLENDLLINFAAESGATHLVRGIRNAADFDFEYQMMLVNRKINSAVHSVFVMTPPTLAEVSSSTVKGLVGLKNWEALVARYCHPAVVAAFREKLAGA